MWADDRNCKYCGTPLQSSGIALDDAGALFVMCDACCARHAVTQLPRLQGMPVRFRVGRLLQTSTGDAARSPSPKP